MFLKSVKIRNFKNFIDTGYEFSSKINAFVGKNGVGKTNLLDAVHYLALTKSYLNYSDVQNVNFDSEFFTIEGIFENDELDVIFCAVHREKGKTFKKNAKIYDRISAHIGSYPLVMISPYDIDLIKDGSDTRRKFIDNIISQSNKEYLNDLIRYNRALNQRNSLLKYFYQNQAFDADTLEIYDQQLIQFGNKIHSTRAKFIQEFEPIFQEYYHFISQGNEKVNIQYISQLNENEFENLLKLNRNKDKMTQFTTTGIHKDDLGFEIMGYPVKKFGSQGQQKSYLIALKLAKLEIIKKSTDITPILLLDDIFDKLDESRVEQLIKLVNEERFGQIFITDTHPERTRKILTKINADSKIFKL